MIKRLGIESVRHLRQVHGDTPLIVLTNSNESDWLNQLAQEKVLTERLHPVRWSTLWCHIERAYRRQPSQESLASQRFWNRATTLSLS